MEQPAVANRPPETGQARLTRIWIAAVFSSLIIGLAAGFGLGYVSGVLDERSAQQAAKAKADAQAKQAQEDAKWIPLFRVRTK